MPPLTTRYGVLLLLLLLLLTSLPAYGSPDIPSLLSLTWKSFLHISPSSPTRLVIASVHGLAVAPTWQHIHLPYIKSSLNPHPSLHLQGYLPASPPFCLWLSLLPTHIDISTTHPLSPRVFIIKPPFSSPNSPPLPSLQPNPTRLL